MFFRAAKDNRHTDILIHTIIIILIYIYININIIIISLFCLGSTSKISICLRCQIGDTNVSKTVSGEGRASFDRSGSLCYNEKNARMPLCPGALRGECAGDCLFIETIRGV